MRFAFIPRSSAFWPVLTTVTMLAAVPAMQADVTGSEAEKPGFFGRMYNKVRGKDEPTPPPAPPPPPAPTVTEKPKVTTPGPKPTVTTTKPKTGTSKASTPAKKPTSSPPAATAKKSEPVKKTEPAEKPAEPAAPAPSAPPKEGEFANAKEESKEPEKPAAAVKPVVEQEAPARLPTNPGWQVVKVNGRDYITGDSMHQFYRFSSYRVEGKHVWFRSNNLILKGTIGSQEMLINNIKFILSYPVQESGGRALFSRIDLCKLIDPVLRPTYISDAVPFDTVVIDAGHGGHDAGARGVYGYEKDFALKMAMVLRSELMRRGFKVVMTRTTDSFVTLSGRVAIANATPNSIFLSLHFNSGSSSAASGIETFALTPQGSSASLERGGGYNANGLTGNAHDSANIALATAVHAMVISKFKFVDRGIKRAQWSVLTGCKRPGILFEGGFVTNGNECRLIASDTYRQSVSSAIADAVVNYRTALRGAMTRNTR